MSVRQKTDVNDHPVNITSLIVSALERIGVHLQRRLNSNCKHCEAVRDKALMSLGRLILLLKSPLPLRSKLQLYKAYVRRMMTYATLAWAFINKSNMYRM